MIEETLAARLELESSCGGFSREQRAVWVAERLAEYASRLAGALELPGWDMAALAGGDTLGVVEAGTNLLDAELASSPRSPEVMAAWRTFRDRWAALPHAADRVAGRDLVASADKVLALLSREAR